MAYSKLAKFSKPSKVTEKVTTAPEAPQEAGQIDPKYTRRIATIFIVAHIIFAVILSLWYFHRYILEPVGFGYIVYILELPGAVIVYLVGQSQNLESAIPYLAAFIINTIFYGFIGYLLGIFSQKYKWNDEINRLLKMEAEVYEDVKEETPAADNP